MRKINAIAQTNYKPDENLIKLYQLDFLKQCPKIEKFKGRVYGIGLSRAFQKTLANNMFTLV